MSSSVVICCVSVVIHLCNDCVTESQSMVNAGKVTVYDGTNMSVC